MNTTKNDGGGPAMPETRWDVPTMQMVQWSGLSKREYAAIHLRVPDSGNEMIDGMIRQRMRDDFAGQALCQCISDAKMGSLNGGYGGPAEVGSPIYKRAIEIKRNSASQMAYEYADTMLAARGGEGE